MADRSNADRTRRQRIHATGHENVTADHESTFEVTTDDWLTPAGDCILGVRADRPPADFDPAFVEVCRRADTEIVARFRVGGRTETVRGRGDPDLSLGSDRSFVGRTSEYVDDRTGMVEADRAAADLDRGLVEALSTGADLTLELEARPGER